MDIITAQIWSLVDGALATWAVSIVEETDGGGNIATVILCQYGNEELRFSPSYTNEEFTTAIADFNKSAQGGN